jgi:multiple sugar transport system substrate-binding protein
MLDLNRRQFGALAAAGVASAAVRPARAQANQMNFMSFTFAEEPNKPFVVSLIDTFKSSSGVSVEPIATAWGDTQRNVMLRQRSRTLPDSVQLQDRWLPSMASLPEIVDLDALIGRPAIEAALAPTALGLGRVGGKQIGIPLISGSVGMVVNSEVLAKAGVAKIPETLAEFRAALIAVRDRVPNSVPFAMATKNPNSIPLDVLLIYWAFGARMIDEAGEVHVASAEGKAAMDFIAGLMKDRLVAPEIDRPDSRRLFAQGNAAFYFDPPVARTFARSFSGRGPAADAFVVPMKTPVLKAGDVPRSVEWGHIVTLFNSPANRDRNGPGAKWISHILSDAVQTTFPLQVGGLPVTKSGRAAPVVQNDPFLKAWAEATVATGKHEIGIWDNSPELSTILSEETQAALLGQKTANAAADSMQNRMKASMAKRG